MAPASLGIANPPTIAYLSPSRSQVRSHRFLQSWFLVKTTVRRSMKGFLSGGQQLYLRNYDIEGRSEPYLVTKVYVGFPNPTKSFWIENQQRPIPNQSSSLLKLTRSRNNSDSVKSFPWKEAENLLLEKLIIAGHKALKLSLISKKKHRSLEAFRSSKGKGLEVK
ncbi:hypothetical protein V6N13_129905 [Hibiscus sabdariffa]